MSKNPMSSRRDFIRVSAAAGTGILVAGFAAGAFGRRQAAAQAERQSSAAAENHQAGRQDDQAGRQGRQR